MPFTGKIGDTLYLKDAGGSHRCVILTKPNDDGNVVVVNFTSARSWKECLVTFTRRDDKRLFDTKTTVNYADARILSCEALTERAKRRPRSYVFCRENHVKKIVKGALQSQHTPLEILEELRIQYPKEHKRYCTKGN